MRRFGGITEGRMRRLSGITVAGCALALGGLWVLTGAAAHAVAQAAVAGPGAAAGGAHGIPATGQAAATPSAAQSAAGRSAAAQPAAAQSAAAQAAAARPALWRTYDMIVNLENLPRTYTCDQLWYELHGILLQLGAWSYSISILPYNCSPKPNADMRSPNVEVRFQLPFFLTGEAAKSAPAKAVERTIRLSPGEPKTLQPSDCQLMQQVSQTLLASILARVDEEHFDCSGSARQAANFHVTVTLPVAVNAPAVTATSAPAPH